MKATQKNEQLKAIDNQKLANAVSWVLVGLLAVGLYALINFTSLSNHLID
jgi:hypothetical protein